MNNTISSVGGTGRAVVDSFLCLLILALVLSGCAMPREGVDEPVSTVTGSLDAEPSERTAGEPTIGEATIAESPPARDQRRRTKRDKTKPYVLAAPSSDLRDDAARRASERREVGLAQKSQRSVVDALASHARVPGAEYSQRMAAPEHHILQSYRVPPPPTFHTEQYDHVAESGFCDVANAPLSTFSIDVDTASYSNVRRFLTQGSWPSPGAVRIEELINYFDYDYAEPSKDEPFSISTELATAPWNTDHRLLMVGLRGRSINADQIPPRNLVFLIDVSGSMNSSDKLPLVKSGLRKLTRELRAEDHVSIVVYAGASGLVLEPTSGRNRERIDEALDRLHAGGSTNGADGIRLAYQTARRHFDADGVNRVILASDGDFNVGTTSRDELVRLIERERESGVYLTVLGVGTGNLKDATMEQLADHGNGNYAYLDTAAEARKVLVEEAGSTLVTIAKDVKIQIEFNPAAVAGYRLIGYENRRLADRDFNDDTKDAGEIGAGHTVTALYEIVPVGKRVPGPNIDALRYGADAEAPSEPREPSYVLADELATVKLRYKSAGAGKAANTSRLISRRVGREDRPVDQASSNLRFAAAVATFGMVLTDSGHRGDAGFAMASRLAKSSLGHDPHAYRAEFLRLVAIADGLAPRASLE